MVTPGTPWQGHVYVDMDALEGPDAHNLLEAAKASLRAKATEDGVTIQAFRLDKPPAINGVPLQVGELPPCYRLVAQGVAQ
jgi:hypothetical protein